jgi:hypothetical protein
VFRSVDTWNQQDVAATQEAGNRIDGSAARSFTNDRTKEMHLANPGWVFAD